MEELEGDAAETASVIDANALLTWLLLRPQSLSAAAAEGSALEPISRWLLPILLSPSYRNTSLGSTYV